MNIAYLDLNEDDCIEDYSDEPKRYGGGRIIAAALLSRLENINIFANSKCFDNVNPEKQKQCFPLSLEARRAIKNGEPVSNHIPNHEKYDVFVHHHVSTYLNLLGVRSPKNICWAVGWKEFVHPYNKNVMFFDIENQEPSFLHNQHQLFKIVIGPKEIPFVENQKEDVIFQCSRHCGLYQSILAAQYALKFGIQTYFAGPIDNGYNLLDYIDNKTTHYLGIIDQPTKNKYNKLSKFNTQFQTYNISVTLAAKEASSHGAAILATKVGGWKSYIKDGVNGFFISSEEDFLNAWNNRDTLKQINAYESFLPHSENKMVDSVVKSIISCVNE